MKIIFIGTAEFGVPILEKLVTSDYQPELVITSPDKPVGRKHILVPSPIKKVADKWQIPVLQPNNIGKITHNLNEIMPDLMIVVAYGRLLPNNILAIPKKGVLNIHPSLLPKYRGPSPIQTAILKGESETGTSIMLLDDKMDHGPILSQSKLPIGPSETAVTLHDKLAYLSADLLLKIMPQYLAGQIEPKAQKDSQATFSKILTRSDGQLDLHKTAKELERQIRAYDPWPGAWLRYKEKRLKILKAQVTNLADGQAFKTSQAYLLPILVQPEGKKPMSWEDYLRGVKF